MKQLSTKAIHNYFFVKGLDSIKEGGLLAFITSQGVLDSPKNEPIRRYLTQHSRLVSALRLPSGMFSEKAGTEVGSDLIVLQKQSGKGITSSEEKTFVQTFAVSKGDGISIAFTHNALKLVCVAPLERGREGMPSRGYGTYNVRPRHLCKVTRASIPCPMLRLIMRARSGHSLRST